jgi:hypothetical protein
MDNVAALVAAGREREGTVLSVPGRTVDYSYADFCTNVWKTGNLLRHYGLRAGAGCAVAVGPKDPAGESEDGGRGSEVGWPDASDPLLAILGAGVVGATVDLDPPEHVDCRAFVTPAAWVGRYEPAPGCSVIAYGGPPEDPGTVHFETERWSENPTEPPDPAGPDATFLEGYPQGRLLAAAERVVEQLDLGAGDRLAVCTPLTTAGAVVAGLLAPMAAGATAVLAGPECADDDAAAVVGPAGDLDPAAVIGSP